MDEHAHGMFISRSIFGALPFDDRSLYDEKGIIVSDQSVIMIW